jgi:hypothetical protein
MAIRDDTQSHDRGTAGLDKIVEHNARLRDIRDGNERVKPGAATENWEQPVPFGRHETPEITPDLLPGVFGEYASELAEGLQVSPTMPVLFTLSVLSLALQRKFSVSLMAMIIPNRFVYGRRS